MWHKLDSEEKFLAGLVAADAQLAEHERQRGCGFDGCDGRLHRADYPRKPRGVPERWESEFSRRISFCCAERECRRRRTPPSVRFFGRRVYVAMVVIACTANWATPQEARVPRRTVRRWCRYFRQQLVHSTFWQRARARLIPPVAEAELPGSLLERFEGNDTTRLHHALEFLAPLTTRSAGSSMDG